MTTPDLRHAGERRDLRIGPKGARDGAASRVHALDISKKRLVMALAAADGPVPATELGTMTRMIPGWTRGHLSKLADGGFIRHTPDGWVLEHAVVAAARQLLRRDVDLALILPVEDALRRMGDSDHERRVMLTLLGIFPGCSIQPGQLLREVFDVALLSHALDAGDRLFLGHPLAHIDWTIYSAPALLPILAVEVDSGWHDTPIQQERDGRKNRICRAGGLPLARVRLPEGVSDRVVEQQFQRALGRLARESRLGERAHFELAEALSRLS